MSDKKDKPKYDLVSHGAKFRVVEHSTGLIMRTLTSREEAINFLVELDPKPKSK